MTTRATPATPRTAAGSTFQHGTADWDYCEHCGRGASAHYCEAASPAADGLDPINIRLAHTIRTSEWFRTHRRSLERNEQPTVAQIIALVTRLAGPVDEEAERLAASGTSHD